MIKIDGMKLVEKLETMQQQIEKSTCLLHLIDRENTNIHIGEQSTFGMLHDDAVDNLEKVAADLKKINDTISLKVRNQKRQRLPVPQQHIAYQ